ncbi:MAG: hypothetical protein ACRBDL_07385 [Alphaproteobacteria bacterium]
MAQTLVSRSIAIACLATTSLISQAAYSADPDVYFYPKKTWTVELIDNKTNAQEPVCAISNQLNNGYIVQIAGTQNGFTNINIDFRQDIFQKNRKYEVQYTLPGQDTQLIPTKAFGESLLVADLRKKASFSDQIPSASVLDLRMGGNAFRMYLTGLSAAMKNYENCTAVTQDTPDLMAKTAPPKESIPMQPQEVSSDVAPMPPMPEALAKNGANENNTQTANDLADHKKRPSRAGKQRYTDMMAERLKEESKKYQPETQSEQKTAEIEIIEPEASVSSITPSAPKPKQVAKQSATPTEKAEKVSSVTRETIKSPKAVYTIEKSKKPLVADLTKISKQKETQTVASLDTDKMAQNLSSIEPASGQPNENLIHMRGKISELEKKVSVLMDENQMLDEELKTALKDAKSEKMSVSSDNWNLERATMRFNEAERQIMRLGRQLQTQRAQCDTEKQDLETMLFDPKLTNEQQMAKLASLESELDQTKSESYRQQRLYEERIKILEEQLNAM